MADEILLSIDCGTQSLRTILFDPLGQVAGKVKIPYQPYDSPNPGWAEQDPELFWHAVIQGCSSLKAEYPDLFSRVAGMGVTSQRDTAINLGPGGEILRPSITWLDTRAARGSYRPNPMMKAIYRLLGVHEKIQTIQEAGATNWIRENQPEIWEKTWKVAQVSGFLNYRLTGRVADTPASLVGHLPFDHHSRSWAKPYSLVARLFPVEPEKRSDVVAPGESVGSLTVQAAKALGLPQGLPVIACGSDKACETLGMGVVDSTVASISFGTTATVEVTTARYFEPIPFLPAYSGILPRTWVAEIEIFRGFWMLSWFKEELGEAEVRTALETGCIPEEIMNRLLDQEPPGNRGLMLQPYWGASVKDIRAKGSIIGFGDVHGKGSIYRGIVEGLGFALRDGLETLERRGRFRCEAVAASGGASQSDQICQITADILGRPLFRGATYETSALGAAMVTATGLGLHASLEDAARVMSSRGRIFEPNDEHRVIYDGLYRIYHRIYPRLKGVYHDIQKVTGYPETGYGSREKEN